MDLRHLDLWADAVRSAGVDWDRVTYMPTRQKRPMGPWGALPVGAKLPPGPDADGMAVVLRGSGLVVLDVDVKGGAPGLSSLDLLQGSHDWPDTLTVRTPSGGYHYYFRSPNMPIFGGRVRADRIGFLPGLDFKASGIVILPGSKGYAIEDPTPPAVVPAWLLEAVDTGGPAHAIPRAPAPSLEGPAPIYTREALASLAKGRHGPAWAFLRDCASGDLPARPRGGTVGPDRGPVDALLWQALKAIAEAWPDLDPGQVVRDVLAPSMELLGAHDARLGNPVYSLEDVQRKLARALLEAREEEAAVAPLRDGLAQAARPPWDLYVHLANGTIYIVPRDPKEDVCVSSRASLPTALRDLGFQVSYTSKQGREVLLSAAELTHAYDARPFRAAVRDLTIRETRVDPETLVLHIPTAVRPEIQPRHHPQIDRWLRLMIPDDADRARVYGWIGTFGDLAMSQPALWLTGPAKSGKTLLARSLAALWGKPRPTSGEDAIGRFNADLADCPLVHFDEDFPRDWRGAPRIQDFKNLVDDYAHPLEQKFLPQETLNGSARVVLTSNHFGLVTHATDLQTDDVQALQRRIIHVHVAEDSRAYLEGEDVPGWMASGAMAEHLRSIEESHRATRKLPGHCPLIERKLRTDTTEAYPILLAVSEWLRRADPKATDYSGISVVEGRIAAQPNAIARILSSSDLVQRSPSRQKIRAALESLGERRSVRVPGAGPRWVYLLDMDRYLSWADVEDNGREEILERLALHG